MTVFIILIITCIILLSIHICKNINKNYWSDRNIIQVDKYAWHFIFGKCSLSEVYKKIYECHPTENYVGTFIGLKPVLVLRNLEDIKAVLQCDFQSFHGRGYKTNPKDVLADNLLLIDDYRRWRLVRQKIAPVFTASKLKSMFEALERCASDFVDYIKNNELARKNIFDTLHTYTSASISASLFGIDSTCGNAMESPILDLGRKSIDPLINFNIKFALSNFTPKLFKALNLTVFGEYEYFFTGIIKKVLHERRNTNEKRHHFINTCLKLQRQRITRDSTTGYEIECTDEVLAAQTFSFFFAGVDTSANTMQFTLLELSNNPAILKRLHDEIDRVFEGCNEKITFDELKNLPYLDMIISESMRKYPPIGLMQRVCTKDTSLPAGNVKINKGCIVVVPIYGIHREVKYYSNPELFDPERFSSGNVSKIVKFSYLPFGEGNRICLGARFAHLLIKAGLAWLLRRYTLRGHNYTPDSFESSFFGISDSKARYDLIDRNLAA